jgi:hypothetical protein
MKLEHIAAKSYTSRDLTLVAYLVASGFTLESYEVGKEGLMLFSFPDTNELHEHVFKFYCHTASINPTVYYNTLRSLKAMLKGNRHDDINNEKYEKNYNTISNR